MHHSTIIHHFSILNNEVFKVPATAVKKTGQEVFIRSSRGKKQKALPKKRQEPSRAEGKKQFVFNHSSGAEHECFLGVQTKYINSFFSAAGSRN